jgi:regulator of sigma E protease
MLPVMYSKLAFYVVSALGLALLMVVHETGHLLAARKFGMRVVKFSIGFGPVLYRRQPVGSTTVYQIAIIPFLAYVQIAGMNPYEDIDPKDPGSYANATLWARICTIAAGPLSNYFFASILMFGGFYLGGHKLVEETSMRVSIAQDGPARAANMKDGDRIAKVNGETITDWEQLKKAVGSHPGEAIVVTVVRDAEHGEQTLDLPVTPLPKGNHYAGKILIGPYARIVKVSAAEAAVLSLTEPPKVVYELVHGLARGIAQRLEGKEDDLEFLGPVGIFKLTSEVVESGAANTMQFLGVLSAYLGGFNLLPIPALDGGRLLFLGFEAASRKRADAKIEARVHAIGLVMMLGFIAFLTYSGR